MDSRNVLALLAAARDGMTESLLVYAHQVPVEVLVELVERGLATVTVDRLGRPPIEVAVVKIMDAGRRERRPGRTSSNTLEGAVADDNIKD